MNLDGRNYQDGDCCFSHLYEFGKFPELFYLRLFQNVDRKEKGVSLGSVLCLEVVIPCKITSISKKIILE